MLTVQLPIVNEERHQMINMEIDEELFQALPEVDEVPDHTADAIAAIILVILIELTLSRIDMRELDHVCILNEICTYGLV